MAMEEFLSRQTLLVVAPHADDETIQSGGLMQRVKKAGGKVYVLVLSVGNLDHYTGAPSSSHVKASTREIELGEAMKTLGVDDWEVALTDEHLHLRLDSLPRRDLINIIERGARLCTDKIQPSMLAIPAPSFNQDHEAVYEACVTACRPHLSTMKTFQRVVLVADAPQLTWGLHQRFNPNFYVQLSEEQMERKVQAYMCHKSQVRPEPHMGSPEALRKLAAARGIEISVPYAEAYEALRFVC
ncbi:MAG: PIG-L family deacetylase [Planctomycetaceae bacterium]|nr:PIG-L family deacetylase [Planctomycetaceae bacterium]